MFALGFAVAVALISMAIGGALAIRAVRTPDIYSDTLGAVSKRNQRGNTRRPRPPSA